MYMHVYVRMYTATMCMYILRVDCSVFYVLPRLWLVFVALAWVLAMAQRDCREPRPFHFQWARGEEDPRGEGEEDPRGEGKHSQT